MAIDEGARRALGNKLVEVIGVPHTDTLLSLLPRGDWDDVATKADLRRLEDRLDRFEDRFDRLDDKLHHLYTNVITLVSGFMVAMAALTVALVEFG